MQVFKHEFEGGEIFTLHRDVYEGIENVLVIQFETKRNGKPVMLKCPLFDIDKQEDFSGKLLKALIDAKKAIKEDTKHLVSLIDLEKDENGEILVPKGDN